MKLCGSHFLAVREGPECEVTGVPVVFVQFKLVTACSQDAACNCWRGGGERRRPSGDWVAGRGGAPGAGLLELDGPGGRHSRCIPSAQHPGR